METRIKIDTLADAIDAMLGIQPRKTAVTDPELQELLRIAHLRRDAARSRSAFGAEEDRVLWERRLAPALKGVK